MSAAPPKPRFHSADAKLFAELARFDDDPVAPDDPGADSSDAELYAELSKFCQEGANKGKPGICPENQAGEGGAGPSNPGKISPSAPEPKESKSRESAQKQLDSDIASMQKTPEGKKTLARGAAIADKAKKAVAAGVQKALASLDEESLGGVSFVAGGLASKDPKLVAAGTARIVGSVFRCVHEEVFELALSQQISAPAIVGKTAAKVIGTGAALAERALFKAAVWSMGKLAGKGSKHAERFAELTDGDKKLLAALVPVAKQTLADIYKQTGMQPPDADDKQLAERLASALRGSEQHAEKFSEGGNALRSVEIFAAGTHRGKQYSAADLDSMVRNFKQFSTGQKPGFRVPLVIGHEESQEFLERSDLPAAGWASKVWRDGDKLKADFEDVPPKVAQLLKGKAYRTVSSEVYDEPPEGLPGKGKALRRVALLGGDIPQVKSLDDIPAPEPHSESAPRRFAPPKFHRLILTRVLPAKTAGVFHCFSEVAPMDRDAMLKALAEHGCDMDAIKNADDAALAEMLRVCEAKDEGALAEEHDEETEEQKYPPSDSQYSDPFAKYADDELPEAKDDAEKESYREAALRFAERAKKYMEKYCAMPHADGAPVTTESGMGKPPETPMDDNPMPTPQPKKITTTHQYNEQDMKAAVNAAVQDAVNKILVPAKSQFEKYTEEISASKKKETIEAFCESRLKLGKILPAELDRENPANLFDRLLRADAKNVIHKFKEGGKQLALTELDLQMREIDARPVFKFGEKVPSGRRNPKSGMVEEPDTEVEKVEEAYERFSESFPRGSTKESIVAGFKAERKHSPNVTAEDFLGGITGGLISA